MAVAFAVVVLVVVLIVLVVVVVVFVAPVVVADGNISLQIWRIDKWEQRFVVVEFVVTVSISYEMQ